MRELALPPPLPPAAALYGPETSGKDSLREFACALQARGWRVGGILQENLRREDGEKLGIDAIEVDTGRRIPIVRYTETHLAERICGLDTGLLTEATAALRRAIAEHVDLLVVEKFSGQEKEGGGLADEILMAMAEGVPTLVAVSLDAFDRWSAVTGGLGVLLPMEADAFWRWWGPHRLYRDLLLGLGEGEVRRVSVGRDLVCVESDAGCGLAYAWPGEASSAPLPDVAGKPLKEVAALALSCDRGRAAIGVAAINAFYNRADLAESAGNGLDLVAAADGPVCSVGRFPGLQERRDDWSVIEREPHEGEYPATAAPWLLPRHEWTVVTASSLVDHSLPGLLAARGTGRIALVGPSTPLSARLHAYGVEVLAGFVVSDSAACARAVAAGACFREIRPYGRMATLASS